MPAKTDLRQYARLRTKMDSVVIGALRYYLNAATPAEQQANFNYLDAEFQEIVDKVWGIGKKKITCPDGYHFCDGCCVPYDCIGE